MSAVISDCGKYRYVLERDKGSNPLVFLMLNPSTADASLDDPTIRRCRRFSEDNGYTGIVVVNLYAYRATKPDDMLLASDPIGSDNDRFIREATHGRDVCCAWGANANPQRANDVISLVKSCAANVYCLGKTKYGFPRHPLYVKAEQKLISL